MTEQPKAKRRNGYKGRCMKPAHKLTSGVKPVQSFLFTREIRDACDSFWRDRGIREHIGNMQLCEP